VVDHLAPRFRQRESINPQVAEGLHRADLDRVAHVLEQTDRVGTEAPAGLR
jgi:hypothetical protein